MKAMDLTEIETFGFPPVKFRSLLILFQATETVDNLSSPDA
jgi:hypothetical protein